MGVYIKLPTPLRRHAEGAKSLEVSAGTVGDALAALCERYPGLRDPLYDGEGKIKSFVRVFVGGKDVAELDGTGTPLSDGDQVSIVPPVAGA
ncbi:MAG: molybdopterin synthase sulfur carrier subunit [Armatimonadia bacterium]|nr:molybdopterin synthase sulfur carrier subunit [Armatimonadia bacterium]